MPRSPSRSPAPSSRCPTDEARGRVALFLVLTMAPFVLLAPLIGPLLDRFRHGRRWALGTTLATAGVPGLGARDGGRRRQPLAVPRRARLPGREPRRTPWPARPPCRGCCPATSAWSPPTPRLDIAGLIGMPAGGGLAGAALADRPRLVAAAGVRRLRRRHRARDPAAGPGRLRRPASSTSTARRAGADALALPVRRPGRPAGCGPCRPRCGTCSG